MGNKDYEKAKAECWLDTANYCGFTPTDTIKRQAFDSAFDRAYDLGREKETISQEEIEKAAVEYAEENMWYPGETSYESDINDMTESFADAFEQGANFALSKQERDADTVIQGWVARDEDGDLFFYNDKPRREKAVWDEPQYWIGETQIDLDPNLFPDLTWESELLEVEIIIKRKKE